MSNSIAADLIYLLACAVNDTAPDTERVKAMDLERITSLSEFHGVSSVVCYALDKANITHAVMERMHTKQKNIIRKNMLLDTERKRITDFLDSRGIRYMPLKGVYLKKLYPKSYMRQMSDNDILFDDNYREEVRDWFVENGYTVELYGKYHHDEYQKPPLYNFEMHVMLFEGTAYPLWHDYFDNLWERLIPDGNGCGYHFTDEDFYIYMMTHMAKHHRNAGTGLRSLLDIYVYLKAKAEHMDMAYIDRETEKLGIADLDRECRGFADRLFGGGELSPDTLTEDETDDLNSFLRAGLYGTSENRIHKNLRGYEKSGRSPRLEYLKHRFILDQDIVKNTYPFFYRHKYLQPFLNLYRLVRSTITSRKRLTAEFKNVMKYKSKNKPK